MRFIPGARHAGRARYDRVMAIDAVIFDWGGTLTPWHTIDHAALWQSVCAPHFPGDDHLAAAIHAAEQEVWQRQVAEHRTGTMFHVFEQAGIKPTDAFLATYVELWEPHTFTDPAALGVLTRLRAMGIKTGVLSNTLWPRSWHENIFRRDGVLDLFDGAVYSSEIDWAKPHREAFLAAMRAVNAADPANCVFIGDRPWDDIHGAKSVGMRGVLLPHSEVPPFDGVVPDAVINDLTELPALIESWSGLAA
ncbi:MAG TPA: HAD family hydrolase [Streptosporangiaceae bacterium]|nr:HAD family hydrolase [Streptosporangiaceae bacterium]